MVNVTNQSAIKNAVQAAMKKLSFQRLAHFQIMKWIQEFIDTDSDFNRNHELRRKKLWQ